jgi:hypothetical protein
MTDAERKILEILKSGGYGLTGRQIYDRFLKDLGLDAPTAGDVSSCIWRMIRKRMLVLNVDMTLSVGPIG